MKQRIVFLDFDGVLNSVRTCAADQKMVRAYQVGDAYEKGEQYDSGFDPVAVKLIWQLLMQADAYVVISSSWQASNSLAAMRSIFSREFGWPSGTYQRIIGVTGRNCPKAHRGNEIQHWIDNHTVGIQNFQYIIIDDGADMQDHQFKRLVQPDATEGFLYRDYKKALALFQIDDEEVK